MLSSPTSGIAVTAALAGAVVPNKAPFVITSDRGAQFTSSLWAALCYLLNIQHAQTTAYHP
jgi:hypothetical protein